MNNYRSTWDKLTEERKNAYRTVIKRRTNGETLESIARDYGVTRERIRQIVEKYALDPKTA